MRDLANDDEEEEAACEEEVVREVVMCWIKTKAWREMLKVDVCVMRKSVSICLSILQNKQKMFSYQAY